MLDKETLLRQCEVYFARLSEVRLALLFGSIAGGQFNEHSDVDIAIDGSFSLEDLLTMQRDLSILCKREIDIIDLKKAEGIILHRIMTKGLRIKNDAGLFVHYLKKALYYREDFYPLQKIVQDNTIRRFVNG